MNERDVKVHMHPTSVCAKIPHHSESLGVGLRGAWRESLKDGVYRLLTRLVDFRSRGAHAEQRNALQVSSAGRLLVFPQFTLP